MSNSYSVECFPRGANKYVRHPPIRFNIGSDLVFSLAGPIGPAGLSDSAADLLDFAGAIYQIERQFRGRQRTNPIEQVSLSITLRKPKAWTDGTLTSVKRILQLLGNAVWDVELKSGLRAGIPSTDRSKPPRCTQVALFSGGMDSTCGAATCRDEAERTQLVGFYTRQMTLQEELAQTLGFKRLAQCRMQWKGKPGLTHSFYYRSFFFLCLAAAIAESWEARRILQFENGVLATAVPPAPSWRMTKHAHPLLHQYATDLFGSLFGGRWQIVNPFLHLTKRQCLDAAANSYGKTELYKIIAKTQTCWYYTSNRIVGALKTPNKACGACIPCIVRHTALPKEPTVFDLDQDKIRNKAVLGRAFRSYFGVLDEVLRAKDLDSFYEVLPAPGRMVVDSNLGISLAQMHELFHTFAKEFMRSYRH